MEKEIWKTIITEDGIYENYQVSNLGRVKSLNYRHTGKEKILKQYEDVQGYLHVDLWKNGERKIYKVHRLTAMVFIPNVMNYKCIDHISTVKTDNRVENLRWCTQKQNCNNELTKKHISKTRNNKQVRCIETGEIFESTHEVERRLGIAQQNISACCNGKQKSARKLHWEYV